MNFLRNLLGLKGSGDSSSDSAAQVVTPQRPAGIATTQVLAPLKQITTTTSRIKFGIKSDMGGRENNEDAAVALLISAEMTGSPPAIGVFIVADGMGGHEHGERASSLAARILTQTLVREVVIPQVQNVTPDSETVTIQEILTKAIEEANAEIRDQVPGGGTTATCCIIRGELVYIAHIGDSRAYVYDDNDIEKITRDHSMVERLREIGQEGDMPMRNVLYKALGAADHVEADTLTRRLAPSSRLMLCSDGLWDVVSDDQIRQIMQDAADPQSVCDQLIKAANDAQGEDNITAVCVQMPD